MKKCFFCLLMSLFSLVMVAQSGRLDISFNNVDDILDSNMELMVELLRNDTLIMSEPFDYYLCFSGIPQGKYTLQLTLNQEILWLFADVVAENGATNYLVLTWPSSEIENLLNPTEHPVYLELSWPFRLAYPILEDSQYPIKREFVLGYDYNIVVPLARHIALVNGVGTGFYFYKVKPDFDITVAIHQKERFFKWTLSEALFLRVANKNLRTAPLNYWFVDVGAVYHFPLMFNYTYVNGSERTVTHRIHRYNDVSAMLKLGYAPFSFFVEYNLFDYVKSPYPQMPRMRFGFSLKVPLV